uniref:Uncharacterized protein n=1 Tax=Oryza meridionalis TaxID=40149 RepID=A0A0E0C6Z2_9ORYZ
MANATIANKHKRLNCSESSTAMSYPICPKKPIRASVRYAIGDRRTERGCSNQGPGSRRIDPRTHLVPWRCLWLCPMLFGHVLLARPAVGCFVLWIVGVDQKLIMWFHRAKLI